MTIQKLVGAILLGVPLLALGQTASEDVQAIMNRQAELEKQVREQDARIRDLERLLKERLRRVTPRGRPGSGRPRSPAGRVFPGAAEERREDTGRACSGCRASRPKYIGNLRLQDLRGRQGPDLHAPDDVLALFELRSRSIRRTRIVRDRQGDRPAPGFPAQTSFSCRSPARSSIRNSSTTSMSGRRMPRRAIPHRSSAPETSAT